MTGRVLAVAILGTAMAVVTAQEASAFGARRGGGCDSPCATTGGACQTACAVSYVDQKVTGLKAEWKTRKVDIEVLEYKTVEEKFKNIDCVPTTVMQKVRVCQMTQTTV